MKGKQFLLVYPEIPDTYWSFRYTLRFIDKKALMLPLGLATIAGLVPNTYSLKAIDMNVSPLQDQDIAEADLILISAMLVQKQSFLDVLRRCKALGTPVAAGGPYPTSCLEELKNLPSAEKPDFFILNEGEITFPLFLQDWERGTPREVYQSTEKPSLDHIPLPRFDLFDLNAYNVLPLQFSRGCPYDCEFCDIVSLFGHVPRTKPPARFLEELESALDLGFQGNVFIVDDNFIGNRKRVKELLSFLIRWQKEKGYPVQFCTEASIDLAKDEELLDQMVQAGFYMVFLGIETPQESSLKEAGKTQNLRIDMAESVRKIQSRGIEVTGGFIIGFDSDPADIAERQIQFIQELAIPTAMVGLLTALPGTRLHQRLLQEGRLLKTASGNNTHELDLNFEPRHPKQLLIQGYQRLLAEIYKPRVYFKRCLELLSRLPYQTTPLGKERKKDTISFKNIKILLRSFLKQTFSPYGFSYLSYFFRALRKYPDKIVWIVSFAVQGHHFFKITREIVTIVPQYEGIYRKS